MNSYFLWAIIVFFGAFVVICAVTIMLGTFNSIFHEDDSEDEKWLL
jgi:hypothetical protein